MTCDICLNDTKPLIMCEFCLKSSCNQCIKQNNDKCCHCNYNDSFYEFDRQLDMIKSELTDSEWYFHDESIKPCPVCKTFIEKEETDCCQIYCVICNTLWSWKTGKVYTNIHKRDVHNIRYHDVEYVVCDNVLVNKSLKKLYKEEYNYAVDTFIIRLWFTMGTLTFHQLKERLLSRYKNYIRHMSIRNILVDYILHNISLESCNIFLEKYDANVSVGKLPWT